MCGDCCRNSWQVTVNEASYRRNENLFSHTGRKAEFHQAFVRLQGNQGYEEYAYIAKQPGGSCWFLDSSNRCRLHKEAGHSHLDAVCQTYPRYPMNSTRGIELALSFSCPAVMKLARREEPLSIIKTECCPTEFPENNYTVAVYPQQYPPWKPLRYYFELETHFIDILQCRNRKLAERLSLLAETSKAINSFPHDDTLAGRLTALLNQNYDKMDKPAAASPSTAGNPDAFLMENFLVNLIFKKPFYIYGFEKTIALLDRIWRQMGGTQDVAAAIRQFEMEYGHDRQALWR